MKVLITGGREWSNWDLIWQALRELGPNTVIIHGDCRGADKMAGYVAKKLGYVVRAYPADWNGLGRAAGAIRNRKMFDLEKPELVLAFKNNIQEEIRLHQSGDKGHGTADMVCYARSKGCPVNFIEEEA